MNTSIINIQRSVGLCSKQIRTNRNIVYWRARLGHLQRSVLLTNSFDSFDAFFYWLLMISFFFFILERTSKHILFHMRGTINFKGHDSHPSYDCCYIYTRRAKTLQTWPHHVGARVDDLRATWRQQKQLRFIVKIKKKKKILPCERLLPWFSYSTCFFSVFRTNSLKQADAHRKRLHKTNVADWLVNTDMSLLGKDFIWLRQASSMLRKGYLQLERNHLIPTAGRVEASWAGASRKVALTLRSVFFRFTEDVKTVMQFGSEKRVFLQYISFMKHEKHFFANGRYPSEVSHITLAINESSSLLPLLRWESLVGLGLRLEYLVKRYGREWEKV